METIIDMIEDEFNQDESFMVLRLLEAFLRLLRSCRNLLSINDFVILNLDSLRLFVLDDLCLSIRFLGQ